MLFKASFYYICKLTEDSGTALVAQRTELEHDTLKMDAFIGCVVRKLLHSRIT